MGITTAANATTVDRIRQIHGPAVANELIEFEVSNDTWGFKASGWTSNANYHVKRTTVLLFINHRAVESSAIKKAIEQTYATFLPKGGHPFVYLSLEIEPQRVDVNVHPTKREVNFLNEDEIIEMICNEIRDKLAKVDTSRTFMTQSLLPGVKIPNVASESSTDERATPDSRRTPKVPATPQRPYENNLVRTDSKMRKITSMLPPATTSIASPFDESVYEQTDREVIQCRLASVKELRAAVRDSMHNGLTETFASHTYVGLVDERRRISAIQSGVKLFLIDYGMICNEYFYQVGLTDFGNFGVIKLEPPPSLLDILRLAAQDEEEQLSAEDKAGVDFEAVPAKVAKQLIERKDMLSEYFSLKISDDGKLEAIPLLLKGYTPSLAKLPRFLLRLGPYVDWTDEKNCFHTFLREVASFYVPEQLSPPPRKKPSSELNGNNVFESERESSLTDGYVATSGERADDENATEDGEMAKRRAYVTWSLEHTLFPAFKARLVATKGLLNGVVEVANLKGLYRVFERC
jgi:DNA mismatch repair protein MLH1